MEEFALGKWLWIVFAPSHFLVLLLLLAIFLPLHRWVNDFFASLVALLLFVILLFPVGDWALTPLETCAGNAKLPTQVDGVIVLGGALNQRTTATRNEPQFNSAADRFFALLKLMKTYPNATFIYSGGSGRVQQPDFREADFVKQAMQDIGIDTSRVVFENRARNTAENVKFTRDYFNKQNSQNWVIVTSALHMPRALALFQEEGRSSKTNFYTYPVDFKSQGRFQFELNFDLPANLGKLDAAAKEYVGMAFNHFVMHRTPQFMTCTNIVNTPITP